MVIVQMNDIRLKVMDGFFDVCFRLRGPKNPEGIQEPREGFGVEIHVLHHMLWIYQVFRMLHAKECDLVAHFFEVFGQLKHIGFTAAILIQEFIDHQNFHQHHNPFTDLGREPWSN